jgi:ATP-dependent phosphofructokinase / diphosphate-dependent phosphofructokinase
MKKAKRIAILTGGGDCPGLNAVIRAIVKKSVHLGGYETIGIEDGFEGLIHNRSRHLSEENVSGILTRGGTILGTSNRANPYRYPLPTKNGIVIKDLSSRVFKNLKSLKVDALVCIGGDGTLGIAHRLHLAGVPVVGVPKTIDNDVYGTDVSFGFDTAVCIATEGVDRLHTTAESHHRIMILEVMGRHAGWIALYAGVAGGGDIILIPEIPYHMDVIVDKIKERSQKGKRFTIIVVAEGAKPQGGELTVKEMVNDASEPLRLGGISFALGKDIERRTGIETRNVVMGHLQRGGSPSAFDRILGTQLGSKAFDLICAKDFGYMVGISGHEAVKVSLAQVAQGQKLVPLQHPLIKAACCTGSSFGVLSEITSN